jgi:hypothetical protein
MLLIQIQKLKNKKDAITNQTLFLPFQDAETATDEKLCTI